MTYTHDEKQYTLCFKKGEKLIDGLLQFVREQDVRGAWVKGLGGLAGAELGFYDLTAQAYSWTNIDEPLELTNLTGNIAWQDGEPILHLHATVSDASMHTYGGHLKEAEVGGTVEVIIHAVTSAGLTRKRDEATGLNLLDL